MKKAYPRQIVNLEGSDLRRGLFRLGSSGKHNLNEMQKFSESFSKKIGVLETVLVSSARFGLALLLEELGFERGDEILLSTYTYHAMPNVIAALGLKPVFVDIQETDFNIDPAKVRQIITRKTKAIIATHIYGQPCDMNALKRVCRERSLFLIEDCAEATGAKYHGKPVGSIGDAGLFSFSMGKPLTGFGGGAITTSNRELADNLRRRIAFLPPQGKVSLLKSWVGYSQMLFSSHPSTFRYSTYPLLSLASRLKSDVVDATLSGTRKKEVRLKGIPDSMKTQFPSDTASLLNTQLKKLDAQNSQRIAVAEVYNELFSGQGVAPAALYPKNKNIYNAYAIRIPGRDIRNVQRNLITKGIDTKRRHMYVCSEMDMFKEFKTECPVAVEVASELLHLPINHHMTQDDAKFVAEAVLEAVQ